jgi:serine/threonine protein phosphatase PrpC
MRYAVKSDKGLKRDINEDSYNIIEGCSEIPITFVIADGMGGHNSGELASRMAVECAGDYIKRYPEKFRREENIFSAIQEVMEKANTNVYKTSLENKSSYGMGTTFIIAVIYNQKLFIGHVGDSRVYLIREENISRLTTDHSYIEELIKNGSLTREEASVHPNRNVITRALGCSEEMQVDTYSCDLEKNDYLLLCTDGLTNMLEEEEIKEIILRLGEPEPICDELVRKANENGGEDNTTVIVIKND